MLASFRAMAQGSSIVCEWLKSLPGLCQYAEAFIDNGYDDLEVCKQIGEPDLDAIGVEDPDHRSTVLHAVRTLREEGGTRVYFTLEETHGAECYERPDAAITPFAFPATQLCSLVRDKLREEGINILSAPYTTLKEDGCQRDDETLGNLAELYAEDLCTYTEDVLEALQQIWSTLSSEQCIHGQSGTYEDPPDVAAPETETSSTSVTSPRHATPGETSLISMSPRHISRRRPSDQLTENELKEGEQKKTSTLSRLLRSVKLKHPVRKYSYKPHDGDLSATDMTMSDDDRMQLMILVKEGKISMEQAVDTVKHFERKQKRVKSDERVEVDSETSDERGKAPLKSSANEDVCLSPKLPPRNPAHTNIKMQANLSSKCKTSIALGTNESPTLKEKKRGLFSSPFSKRKDSHTTKFKKNSSSENTPLHSPTSGKATDGASGKCFSPQDALPPLPPVLNRTTPHIIQSSSFQHAPHPLSDHSRILNMLHTSRRSSDGPLPLPVRSPGKPRIVPKRTNADYENLKFLSRSDTDLGFERILVDRCMSPNMKESHNSGSDTGLYCRPSPLVHLNILQARTNSSNNSIDSDAEENTNWLHHPAWKDFFMSRTSKRHTPPSGTPPEFHLPKRPHFQVRSLSSDPSTNVNKTVVLPRNSNSLPCNGEWPSVSDKSGPYEEEQEEDDHTSSGSSSTMSLTSAISPTTTPQSETKIHDAQTHTTGSFSTIEAVRSSNSKTPEFLENSHECSASPTFPCNYIGKGRDRSQSGGSLLLSLKPSSALPKPSPSLDSMSLKIGVTESKSSPSSLGLSGKMEGRNGFGLAKALVDCTEKDMLPYKKDDIITVISDAVSGIAQGMLHGITGPFHIAHIEMLAKEATTSLSLRGRQKKPGRRSRPRTVEELLVRLNLQHLFESFSSYSSLSAFSQLDEEDLDELHILDPEARTKLITAAQMLLDQEDLDDSSSLENSSCHSNSSHSSTVSDTSDHSKCRSSHSMTTAHLSNTISSCVAERHQQSSLSRSSIDSRRSESPSGQKQSAYVTSSDQHMHISSTREQHSQASVHIIKSVKGSSKSFPSDANGVLPGAFMTTHEGVCAPNCNGPSHTERPERNGVQINSPASLNQPQQRDSVHRGRLPSFIRPGVPIRTVSLTSQSTSCPSTPTHTSYKDAETQDGSCLMRIKARTPSPGDRLTTSRYTAAIRKTAQLDSGGPVLAPSNPDICQTLEERRPKRISQSASNTSRYNTPALSSLNERKAAATSSVMPFSPSQGNDHGYKEFDINEMHQIELQDIIKEKLHHERIDLSRHPYSSKFDMLCNQNGVCGIPTPLVQRYARELQTDVKVTAKIMEQERVSQLQQRCLPYVLCRQLVLGMSDEPSDCPLSTDSIESFLISVGLPMYITTLVNAGISSLAQLALASPSSLQHAGVEDSFHQKFLLENVDRLLNSVKQPKTKGSMCHITSVSTSVCPQVSNMADKV